MVSDKITRLPFEGNDVYMIDRNNIMIIYGDNPSTMIPELFEKGHILEYIGGDKDILIGIKPNLVVEKPSHLGATTDPRIVIAIIEYLKAYGYHNIIILESSWVGADTKKAYKVCGYEDIANKYDISLIDLKDDIYAGYGNNPTINICNKAMEVDFLINIPVLKAHCQTKLTCALKNLKGCVPDVEKRRFHTMGLHEPIAWLNKYLKSDLVIVDGIWGDLTFEEGGTPVFMNRIIMGRDPVLIDSYAARLIGYSKDDIRYICIAEEIGVGCTDLSRADIIELNHGEVGIDIGQRNAKLEYLSKYINAKDACSACYGSLIHALERIREKGFLDNIDKNVYIGQGYKGKDIEGIGIGSCTRGANIYLKGCPPSAKDIVDFLMKYNI